LPQLDERHEMFRLIAFVLFLLAFLLELLHTSLGVFTPLASAFAGLAFLALAGVDFGTVVRRRR
jgi:hypothetical protein